MIINLARDFMLKQIVNQSRRLVKEYGMDNRVWVIIEPDQESILGYSVYWVDITTHDRLKVDAERLRAYYERQEHKDLSNISLA